MRLSHLSSIRPRPRVTVAPRTSRDLSRTTRLVIHSSRMRGLLDVGGALFFHVPGAMDRPIRSLHACFSPQYDRSPKPTSCVRSVIGLSRSRELDLRPAFGCLMCRQATVIWLYVTALLLPSTVRQRSATATANSMPTKLGMSAKPAAVINGQCQEKPSQSH
jgi:hypothetical protein